MGDPAGVSGPSEGDASDERVRYRELLEELRTIIPGVQVLFAFLLTAPFAQRFRDLEEFEVDLYGVAVVGTAVATILFLAPASYHRVAPRRPRPVRIRTAIRFLVSGMLVLAVSILAAVLAVTRFVFGAGVATITVVVLGTIVVLVWYALPLLRRLLGERGERASG